MIMRPTLIPTIFTLVTIIILLALGTWQLKRLYWKNNLVTEITERGKMSPLTILAHDKIDIDAMRYRKVSVTGHFLHDKEVHLFTGAREMRGKNGYNIITPLEQEDGSVILVDRGWVPAEKKERASRADNLPSGELSVVGMLQSGEHPGIFTPKNNIDKNLWFWIDIPAIAGFAGKALQNVYVRVLQNENDGNILPIAGKDTIEIRNDHLEYAIIWYSLALALLVIYLIYINGKGMSIGSKNIKAADFGKDSK